MAKHHVNYAETLDSTGRPVPVKLAKAYAEGFNYRRNGGLDFNDNPHPAGSPGFLAWQQGVLDCNTFKPPTHVGGLALVPPLPPEPEPEDEEE